MDWRSEGLRLKRLEIQGFKSFVDKTVLEFGPGLVAVVGPNGSGKSNLVDAVRWALGEQNPRVLRANRMEDLIFSGANGRRPVSLCEVTLVIDNEDGGLGVDYSEVSVTRRMSRDGISDYYINRKPCRLKDVQDLLSDTGIGREAYSIIGQGKIDEVLSARPEDRRGLFEEAAGIVRFRNRKREALKKLEETREGQVRLSDIIDEVSLQVPPLTEQAEKAKVHGELHSSLTRLEIGREISRADRLEASLLEKRAEVSDLSDRSGRERERLSELEAEYAEVAAALTNQQEMLVEREQALALAELELRKAESERALIEEKISSARANLTRAHESRLAAAARGETLAASLAEQSRALEDLRSLSKCARDEASKAGEALECLESEWKRLSEGLEAARQALMERRREAIEQKNKALSFAEMAKNSYLEAERLQSEAALVEKRLAGQKERCLAEVDRMHLAAQRANHAGSRLPELERQLKQSMARTSEMQAHLKQHDSRIFSQRGRIQALSEMKERLEGYGEGARRVIQAARSGRIAGVVGTVAELLRVQPGYEKCIEAVLGGSAQFIVMRTADDAKRAIDMLRAARGGRATFLPLDTIKPGSLTPREAETLAQIPGAQRAVDVVSCEHELRLVVEHLLGRTAVAPDIDCAVEVARATRFGVRIGTLQGDLVNVGGSMTGGERGDQRPGLLSRQAELERLEGETKALEATRKQLEDALSRDLAAQSELVRGKAEAEQALKAAEAEAQSIASVIHEMRQFIETTEQQVEELRAKSKHAHAMALAHCRSAHEIGLALRESAAALSQMETQAAQAAELLASRESSRIRANAEFTRKREALVRAEELETAAARRLGELTTLANEVAATADVLCEEHDRIEQSVVELENTAKSLLKAEQVARGERDRASVLCREAKEVRDNSLSRLSALERSLRQTSRSIDTITLRLVEQTAEETRLSTSLEAISDSLKARFSMGLEEARATYPALDETVEPRIAEIKEQIALLGPVNHSAPEELRRLDERMVFLRAQVSDLDRASADLLGIIDDIDSKMREMFKTSFARIREDFRRVFRELFGGGDADLRLDDPSNILESGIEISARPPGRNTQALSLLSGGERCLTAIALLFAMQNQRPSPFCVLDEIEASLDEANVERFCVFLQRLSVRSQYILITHQKRTMEASDVLYGLTMEETGVSKTLSVKMAGVH